MNLTEKTHIYAYICTQPFAKNESPSQENDAYNRIKHTYMFYSIMYVQNKTCIQQTNQFYQPFAINESPSQENNAYKQCKQNKTHITE